MRQFDYSYIHTALSTLEVEDTAQCCIELIDVLDYHYYMIIQTVLGKTKILEYGPIIPDIEKFPPKSVAKFCEIDCNKHKIDGMIEKFLGSHSPKAEGVSLIPIQEARKIIRNFMDAFVEEEK